jgi:hypothetical protein
MQDIDDDLMLREALECQAARLCVENASDEGLERLMKKAAQVDRFIRADTPDQSVGSQLHWEFHAELGRLSGHAVFGAMLEKVWFQRYMSLSTAQGDRFEPSPDGWHQILVRKIRKRDPELAERAMREHVRYGRKDDREALAVYLQENAVKTKKSSFGHCASLALNDRERGAHEDESEAFSSGGGWAGGVSAVLAQAGCRSLSGGPVRCGGSMAGSARRPWSGSAWGSSGSGRAARASCGACRIFRSGGPRAL